MPKGIKLFLFKAAVLIPVLLAISLHLINFFGVELDGKREDPAIARFYKQSLLRRSTDLIYSIDDFAFRGRLFMMCVGMDRKQLSSMADCFEKKRQEAEGMPFVGIENDTLDFHPYFESNKRDLNILRESFEAQVRTRAELDSLLERYRKRSYSRVLRSKVNKKLDRLIRMENDLFVRYRLKMEKLKHRVLINHCLVAENLSSSDMDSSLMAAMKSYGHIDSLEQQMKYIPHKFEYTFANTRNYTAIDPDMETGAENSKEKHPLHRLFADSKHKYTDEVGDEDNNSNIKAKLIDRLLNPKKEDSSRPRSSDYFQCI